jgi:hypothetical protein
MWLLLLCLLILTGCQTVIKPNPETGKLERCKQWTPFPLAPAMSAPWFDYECERVD